MHWIDWTVMLVVLGAIIVYGMWKTRTVSSVKSYLQGDSELGWWTIGLSVMSTQASAITFLSTPGQAYDDGMRFVQFYFGMPIATIILAVFVLPMYYRLKVYTAYEFLEQRFDLKTRTLAAILFLFSRGMAAGFTIAAPSIVLSSIMDWNLPLTIVLMGLVVTIYTVFGGTKAVSVTQKQQMSVILIGMIITGFIIVSKFPADVSLVDGVGVAREMGKMKALDFKWDLANRYNIWSGMIASVFLFLSYFGTDQSQVQRYLSGRSLREGRMGLLFNGFIKIPMQYLILFTGVTVFIFFQFVKPPIHYNRANLSQLEKSETFKPQLDSLEKRYDAVFQEKEKEVMGLVTALQQEKPSDIETAKTKVIALNKQELKLRSEVDTLLLDYAKETNKKIEPNDKDYVFITFIVNYLPKGMIGLLLAVIFCAAMSSISSELSALATTTVVDVYRRSMFKSGSDSHYLGASKRLTIFWGALVIAFASIILLFENLIQAVNIIGSLLYGTILGIFVVAFAMKWIRGTAVFIAAIIGEAVVLAVYFGDKMDGKDDLGFIWLNPIGCLTVMAAAAVVQGVMGKKE
ncbi:MAG: sodium:solute symporter [Saprospiraceae bacterium]|nr:sodium:solute symporter [Saprospiraceae bacterium]